MDEIDEKENILRPLRCELNQLSMPDGSAMYMQGDTAVVVGIYGPVEGKLQKMMYDKAFVDVTYSSVKGPPKIDDRMMELNIKETCESVLLITLHPGTAICINVQELQDSGGLLACAINASCLALINSGLSMKFTVAAVSCMIDKESNEIVLDPDNTKLQNAKAVFTYAFDSVKMDVVCCHTEGRFTEKEFLDTMEECKQASQYVFDFYRDVVKKYANRI